VLCRILSFLPTEDAFTTTLLSKRWTSLWFLVPTLDLDQKRFMLNGKSILSFLKFVYAAIFKRSLYQPIKMFRLCAGSFDFEQWECDIEKCSRT
jgi:hypothetical protein